LSLERCVLLSNAETSAVAVTFGEQIVIESSDPQAGEATETVDCVGSPKEPLRVGVNAGYLIQLLKRLEGDVRIALPKTNQSPLLFKATPKDGETLDYIVMPLRLEK
jgi:DNA polymerase III sliding clamp (beta) subunit (PCNA family)